MDEPPAERAEPADADAADAVPAAPVPLPRLEPPAAKTSVDVRSPRSAPHTLKEFAIQLVTITAGVLIALAIDGVVEWKDNRDLVREATATITREIADNRAALERHHAEADTREKDAENALQLTNDLLATRASNIRQFGLTFHLSTLSSAAWQTAERTGAVAHMEYADVQKYAKLYNVQALYEGEQRRVMAQVVGALSSIATGENPHKADVADLERFRQQLLAVRGAFIVDRQLGEALLKAYGETLAR